MALRGEARRRVVVCAVGFAVACLTTIGSAQTGVTTGDEYAEAMRMTSTAFAAVRTALSAANFADAKEKLATTREGFTKLESFWAAKKRDDAIEIVRTALAQIDEIDALLEVERPSRADTLAAARTVQRACESCHMLYREGEPETGFRFKAGVL